jgi:hypothetical protein
MKWKHDDGKGRVFIKKLVAGTPQQGGVTETNKYQVHYKSSRGFSKPLAGPGVSTKEKARKRAVAWMKSNPSPSSGVV